MNKGNLLLLFSAIIWGFSLVSQQAGMEVMGPWSFTAVRCTLGGVSMLPLIVFLDRKKAKENSNYSMKKENREILKPSLICGTILLIFILMQQYGLLYTNVGKGAFISAFYIFLTPVCGLLMGRRPGLRVWITVVLALTGLYFITMTGGLESINRGDVIMFAAAFLYTAYILTVDHFVNGELDTVKMACFQFIFIGLAAFIPAVILEPGCITWENYIASIVPIFYAGVISCAGGYTLQMVGQSMTEPNAASIILSSETLFSLFAGWLVFHEVLRIPEYIGCGIMTAAILLAVLPDKAEKTN